MKRKQWLTFGLTLALCFSLAACGSASAVYVQSVSELVALGGIAPGDRFAGIVVSENVTEIQKDADKTIEELLVKAGDDVKEGQKLFSYDTEELQLSLDKQRLEKEQLEATIENYKTQIADLEKDRDRVGTASKLQYTIQIQTTQVDLKEAELNLKAKEKEVEKSENLLENAEVTSPVNGRIQSVNKAARTATEIRWHSSPFSRLVLTGSRALSMSSSVAALWRGTGSSSAPAPMPIPSGPAP